MSESRQLDAMVVESASLAILKGQGLKTHEGDNLHLSKAEQLVLKISRIDPATVDCAVAVFKVAGPDGNMVFVGGFLGNIDELNALEGLTCARLEQLRLVMEDKPEKEN